MTPPDVRKHNESVLRKAKPGDRIKFQRRFYSHWVVYVGGEEVVHLTGNDGPVQSNLMHVTSVSGEQYDKAVVKKENFWKAAGNSVATIENTFDAKRPPLPSEQIVDNARQSVGKEGYNILTNNCEHFANLCCLGKSESKQVKFLLGLVLGFLVTGVAIVIGFGICLFCKRGGQAW